MPVAMYCESLFFDQRLAPCAFVILVVIASCWSWCDAEGDRNRVGSGKWDREGLALGQGGVGTAAALSGSNQNPWDRVSLASHCALCPVHQAPCLSFQVRGSDIV